MFRFLRFLQYLPGFYAIFSKITKFSKTVPNLQTSTQVGSALYPRVEDYRLTYYMKDYRVDVTDLLAAFRVIAQPGVPPEEAGATIAAESSTGTWTTVWTDDPTSHRVIELGASVWSTLVTEID